MVWLRRDVTVHLILIPAVDRSTFHQTRLLQALSWTLPEMGHVPWTCPIPTVNPTCSFPLKLNCWGLHATDSSHLPILLLSPAHDTQAGWEKVLHSKCSLRTLEVSQSLFNLKNIQAIWRNTVLCIVCLAINEIVCMNLGEVNRIFSLGGNKFIAVEKHNYTVMTIKN